MSYISELFARVNIQQIRAFILYGTECSVTDKNYEQRIKEVQKETNSIINEKFPDFAECDNISKTINLYAAETESVYMEIGMQCGFMLAMQFIENIPNKADE